jgi:hypothetical protein
MKHVNDDESPSLSNYLTHDELVHFATLLEKVTAGYRAFYGLKQLFPKDGPPVDDILRDQRTEGITLDPPIAIAHLEELLDECWTITDPPDEQEEGT